MFYLAIVGRPNAGKSTLFNRIAGGRPAIVKNTPGVTRDRNIAFVERYGRNIGLIDTGGFEPDNSEQIASMTMEQALLAIEEADEIYFVTDGKEGPTLNDERLATELRKSGKRVWLVINKIDGPSHEANVNEFYKLGFDRVYPISAEHAMGVEELLEDTVALHPEDEPKQEEEKAISVAFVGRPNAGKSSLVNRLLGQERMIVSETAGTTRDSVDTIVSLPDGRRYRLIDTAGIRRKSKVSQTLEKYSVIMAMKAMERADVVLLLIDAAEGANAQEAKIAGIVEEAGKGLVFVVNKWDLLQKDTHTMKEFEENSRLKMKFAARAPMAFISAATGQRVDKLWGVVDEVKRQLDSRIGSGALNSIISKIVEKNPPPLDGSRRVKIYFATQVSSAPPTFVIMTNRPEGIHFSYKRYLENRIREESGMGQAPMRFIFRRPSGRRSGGKAPKRTKARAKG